MATENFIWQNFESQARMKYLLTTEHLSDCSFNLITDESDGITVKCHKFVLVCSSPVFERMLIGHFAESRNSENIVLGDVSVADFKTFIEYLYVKDKNLANAWNLRTLQNLISLAKKFMVKDLIDLCFSTIIDGTPNFSTDEVINLYFYAQQMKHQDLITVVTWTFERDHIKIFKSPAILDLSLDYFLSFITALSVSHEFISQLELFNVIEKYCKKKNLVKEPLKAEDSRDNDNEQKKILNSEFQSTAPGNDAKEKTESEEKKALNDEDKMLQEVNKGMKNTKSEEKKALNQGNQMENKLDKGMKNTKSEEKKALNKGNEMENKLDKEEKNRVEKEVENKEFIAKLLSLVKFENLTATQFCDGPGLSSMIDFEMKYNILKKIVKVMPSIWKKTSRLTNPLEHVVFSPSIFPEAAAAIAVSRFNSRATSVPTTTHH